MNLVRFISDYIRFRRMALNKPRLRDLYPASGKVRIDRHYMYQDCWAIHKIAGELLANPLKVVHHDFGSRVDGFVGQLAATGIYVWHHDIKPPHRLPLCCSFFPADITNLHDYFHIGGLCLSVSCLHVLEHIGLGRYGDTLDPGGHLKAIGELKRIMAPGGNLYVSVPVGVERTCFNAHRIFDAGRFGMLFTGDGQFEVVEFSGIDDCGDFHCNIQAETFGIGAEYSLGMWHLRRTSCV